MPYDVVLLRVGYCKEEHQNQTSTGSFEVACTITLLKGKHNILVDTGSAWDASYLVEALAKNGLTPDNIDYIIGTHGHSDHIGNLNMFTNSTHIVCHDINKGNIYYPHPFNENIPYVIDEDVSVESTPGHTSQDITVYVQSHGALGLVAVAGDVFESEEDLVDTELWQSQSQFPDIQAKSRDDIIMKADTIIPGHGAMFKSPKSKQGQHTVMITSMESMAN